jgi:hypothetical protein
LSGDNTTRCSDDRTIRWNVYRTHGSPDTDSTPVANPSPFGDRRAFSNPDVISNQNWFGRRPLNFVRIPRKNNFPSFTPVC